MSFPPHPLACAKEKGEMYPEISLGFALFEVYFGKIVSTLVPEVMKA